MKKLETLNPGETQDKINEIVDWINHTDKTRAFEGMKNREASDKIMNEFTQVIMENFKKKPSTIPPKPLKNFKIKYNNCSEKKEVFLSALNEDEAANKFEKEIGKEHKEIELEEIHEIS